MAEMIELEGTRWQTYQKVVTSHGPLGAWGEVDHAAWERWKEEKGRRKEEGGKPLKYDGVEIADHMSNVLRLRTKGLASFVFFRLPPFIVLTHLSWRSLHTPHLLH